MLIGIAGWIVLGAIIGFVISKLVNLRGDDPRIGIAVSAGAAAVGGGLYSVISGMPVSAFNLWSLLFASIAAAITLVAWHLVRSRSPYERPTSRRSY